MLQINGCLSQILNGDMTFDDAEYFLLKPRIFEEIKKLNIRKEFLDLYEDVMLFDAFILFGKFEEQALKKRKEKLYRACQSFINEDTNYRYTKLLFW
ncbi:hypothetical protein ERX55_00365 [Macrococcus bovicus]|uniref:Uncharacterized protein n=1 Tax=Macrococcus bovicus TaxID=69968 RepID=A0A4R6C245_9STAP|nr:hypothetical protein ERX55_00365 [Macrococcus bovicus]